MAGSNSNNTVVTEQEIAEGLEAIIRETQTQSQNPNNNNSSPPITTFNDVVLRLQSKLNHPDLSHKLDFIRNRLSLLISNPNPNPNPNLNNHHHFQSPNLNHVPNPNYQHVQHHQQQQHVQHVTQQGQQMYHYYPTVSHFPASFGSGAGGMRGPTEISFAQPGSVTGGVESLSSPHPHAHPHAHAHPAPAAATAKESAQARPKRRGGPGGLNKLCGVSPLLQKIVGQPAMPRTEIVKQLWVYIRQHNLQDPSNKRKIICNEDLKLLFEVDATDMFQMNKLLAKHILPLDASKNAEQPSKKLKVESSQVPSTETEAKAEPKPEAEPEVAPVVPEGEPEINSSPIVISEGLAKFFGTNEKEMLQSEVYKRIEEYIKVEGLEDPLNSMVICDTKLQELFDCESIPVPGIREVIARNHLFQRA